LFVYVDRLVGFKLPVTACIFFKGFSHKKKSFPQNILLYEYLDMQFVKQKKEKRTEPQLLNKEKFYYSSFIIVVSILKMWVSLKKATL